VINLRKFLLICCLLPASTATYAWGENGHRAIGALALDNLSASARHSLYSLLKFSNITDITQWCIWPDAYRATDAGAWTAPLHFVNIPEGASGYEMSRDCGDDMCVTEAITRFVAELGDTTLPVQQRREAFGFVCHFIGDLSQPLHAGFASDRGGNDFSITFNGQSSNLHRFWDSTLVDRNSKHWNSLHKELQKEFNVKPGKSWDSNMPVQWTNESHFIAEDHVYPDEPRISQDFSEKTWLLIRQQLATGGHNLATVLESVLGN
jgi:hypothetical protein